MFLLSSLTSGKYFLPHLSLYTDCCLGSDSLVLTLSAANPSCRGNPREMQVGGTLAGLLSHTLPQAQLWSDQAPQGITQLGPGHCPRLEVTPHCCILVPLSGCPPVQKASSYLIPEPLMFQFITTVSNPLAMYCCEKPGSLMTSS